MSDKPEFIKKLPLLGKKVQEQIDLLARKRAQSLQEVDRGVSRLVAKLKDAGQLANTVIIFTSDNGFHLGQHRMPAGKQTAYETDIHLPLLVRGPGVSAGSHTAALTGNIDLAPTIAAIGSATLADNPDGRSLLPLLAQVPGADRKVAAPAGWRQSFLLEHWTTSSTIENRPGAGQLEPDDQDQGGATSANDNAPTATTKATAAVATIPEFNGLRVAGFTYVEYRTGERELYDLTEDPDELTNLASRASPARLAAFHQRLQALQTCAGEKCRQAENQPFAVPA